MKPQRHFFETSRYDIIPCVRVKDPNGCFLEGEYIGVGDIPELIWSRDMSFRYQLDDCEIVHGYSVRPKENAS